MKYRKRVLSIFLILTLMCLSGCGNKSGFVADRPYITVTNTFVDEEISVRYPQVRGLGDDVREKKINKLIKDDIIKRVFDGCTLDRSAGEILDKDVDFQVKMHTPEILSVLYTYYSTSYTGSPDVRYKMGHWQYMYTITIDMQTGEKMKLSDFTSIDMDLVKKVKESERVTNKVIEERILGYGGPDDIAEFRQEISKSVREISDESLLKQLNSEHYNYFCVTSSSLILGINIPEAAGSFALVEVPR